MHTSKLLEGGGGGGKEKDTPSSVVTELGGPWWADYRLGPSDGPRHSERGVGPQRGACTKRGIPFRAFQGDIRARTCCQGWGHH